MTEMAQRQRLALWQHFPLRYQPLFQSIKSGVDRGKYGDIYRIEASYNWGRTDKLFYGWRAEDPEYSLVLGGMIHMIDLVNWLLGGEEIIPMGVAGVTSLPMRPDVADTVSTLCVNDDGGMTISLTVDGGRGVKDHNHRLLVHGSKGGRSVVNHEPTNKRAMIHDFVKQVESGKQSMEGLSAMATALQIDHALTNAMDEEVLIEI
jgi:predicted dehydrogenase